MKTPTSARYTNEASPEFLLSFNKPLFTEAQLATFNEESVTRIQQRQLHCEAHPAIGIYRMATEGSQTRDGGVIQHGTAVMEATLDNGQKVRVAKVGDYAVYPDGRKAQIKTGAGHANSHIAMIGSRLSNGDEIINTPYGGALLLERRGIPMASDFLPSAEG